MRPRSSIFLPLLLAIAAAGCGSTGTGPSGAPSTGSEAEDGGGEAAPPADPATPAADPTHWTKTGALAEPRSAHTATRLLDGRVLVVGGEAEDRAMLASTARRAGRNFGRLSRTTRPL